MPDETLLASLTRELFRYQGLAERALTQVDDAAFFSRLGEEDNSLAVLVQHLAGNLRSRFTDFLTTDGEKPDRHRDREFEVVPGDPVEARRRLMTGWAAGWQILAVTLDGLDEQDLSRTVTIRGEPFTVRQALLRALTHYAYHCGQIVLLAKHHAGPRWKSLSVPRGGSEAHNRQPGRYL